MTTRNREFKDWSEQLTEHETYQLYNGEPKLNDGTFKVCPIELKLVFNGGTTISKVAIPEIPTHQYKFKPIVDFLTGKYNTDLLYGDMCFYCTYGVYVYFSQYMHLDLLYISNTCLHCDNISLSFDTDVIGVLQDVVKTQMAGGGKKSCANITLRDEAGNIIEVVLWDDYGKQFMSYNTSNKSPGPTVIVLTHAWCKQNQGYQYL